MSKIDCLVALFLYSFFFSISISRLFSFIFFHSILHSSDPLCPKTLYNAYTKAKQPDKLFIRVLQQRDPEVDGDCLEDYCKLMAKDANKATDISTTELLKSCPYADQVFIHEIHASEAAGPTWARGLLSQDMEQAFHEKKVKPQDHCMSLDSHMDFEHHWDDRMVDMWDQAQNEYAVLSTYVQDIEHLGEEDDGKVHQVPHLCMITYTSNVRTHATKCVTNLSKPKLTNAVWGAGLSFSKCHAELKVQVDPHTPHIFDGEEFNRAARFFTHGYDVYTPNHVFVLHDYHKSQSNPIMHTWHQNGKMHGSFADSNKRLRTMIELPNGEPDPLKALRMQQSKYGLGDRRSIEQLIQFSGFDLRHEKITIDGKNRCGNIQWVPFVEHPKGVNHIPTFDEAEDPLEPYDETSVWIHYGMAKDEILKKQSNNSNGGDNPIQAMNLDQKLQDLNNVVEENEEAQKVIQNGVMAERHAELQDKLEEHEIVQKHLDNQHEQLENQMKQAEEQHAQKIAEKVKAAEVQALEGLGKLKDKAHHGAEVVHDFMAAHPLPKQDIAQGFSALPTFVKINVFIMIASVSFFIIKGRGTGRVFRRNQKNN